MKEYAAKDIAKIVGIATPKVRKYAQVLQIAAAQEKEKKRFF